MSHDPPIVGFRQDRIGARLICLLNVMRLARRFDVPGRYLWLSEPSGPYPELVDPRDFLRPGFVRRHIDILPQAPDLTGRGNLRVIAPRLGTRQFAGLLAEGQRFQCDAMAEIIRFMDESPEGVAEEIRGIAAGMALSGPLERALERARETIARAGGGRPVAIHVRRGDILDGDPWSYSAWSAKYVPDEFFRAFVAGTEGPVIAFSDTPAAIAHLARGDPRVLAVAGLLGDGTLSPAERDLLELLLMAGCAEVAAPYQSAYSRAAGIIGRCRILSLPSDLPTPARMAAYDALLERAIRAPDSFFAPGDLAQSLAYLGRHAVQTGRGDALVDAFAGRRELLERFPFLYRELAVAALESGRPGKARRLAQQGLDADLTRNRDKPACRQVLLVAGGGGDGPADIEADFLAMLFDGRAAQGPVIPPLAARLLAGPGRAARALMIEPGRVALCAQPDPATGAAALPLWVPRIDWAELIRNERLRGEMLLWPELRFKLAGVSAGLGRIEERLAAGDAPEAPDDALAMRIGFCAALLRLHGRLNRAFALLHWLDAARPGAALTHKRLADACFHAGNRKAGQRWLDSALALAPDNPLLSVSAALRATDAGEAAAAEAHLQAARRLWPGLDLARCLPRELRRPGRD